MYGHRSNIVLPYHLQFFLTQQRPYHRLQALKRVKGAKCALLICITCACDLTYQLRLCSFNTCYLCSQQCTFMPADLVSRSFNRRRSSVGPARLSSGGLGSESSFGEELAETAKSRRITRTMSRAVSVAVSAFLSLLHLLLGQRCKLRMLCDDQQSHTACHVR